MVWFSFPTFKETCAKYYSHRVELRRRMSTKELEPWAAEVARLATLVAAKDAEIAELRRHLELSEMNVKAADSLGEAQLKLKDAEIAELKKLYHEEAARRLRADEVSLRHGMRIDELAQELDRMNVHNETWAKRYAELEKELATVRSKADKWGNELSEMNRKYAAQCVAYAEKGAEMEGMEAERDERERVIDALIVDGAQHKRNWLDLKARIEAAPQVWLWWEQDVEGDWWVRRCSVAKEAWKGCTIHKGVRIERVHAVPVDHIVDANKKDEGHE